LLAGKKEQHDDFSQRILEHHAHAEAREDANLLYVAVTRARQLLFISGCRPNRGQELGWYGLMEKQCRATDEASVAGTPVFESGEAPTAATTQAAVAAKSTAVDPRLQHPLIEQQAQQESVAPSAAKTEKQGATTDSLGDADSLTKGIAIHRMLELLCEGEQAARIGKRVTTELSLDADSEELVAWLETATDLVNKAELQWIFAPPGKAYNEAPIQYRLNNKTVFGIIDRLLVDGDNVWIIDYKTHAVDSEQAMSRLVAEYRNQLALYCQGAARLWPGKTVRGGLLFTHSRQFIEIT
jgi:ATP-dependent helicase/nuclease subunit A